MPIRDHRGQRQRGEGSHLDEASGDPCPRSDLLVTEKPDPDGQQVAAKGGQGEGGTGDGDQPAVRHQRPDGEDERHDELHQEQPADGGDRPVSGQVQDQVNAGGHDEQQRPRDPQPWLPPVAQLDLPVLAHGPDPQPEHVGPQWLQYSTASGRGRGPRSDHGRSAPFVPGMSVVGFVRQYRKIPDGRRCSETAGRPHVHGTDTGDAGVAGVCLRWGRGLRLARWPQAARPACRGGRGSRKGRRIIREG